MEVKLNTTLAEGVKVLRDVPKYLEGAYISNNDKIIDMGNLRNFKKFMGDNKDFTNSPRNSSMKHDSNGWSGVSTYDEYMNILDDGDMNVITKMKEVTGKKVAELSKKYEEVINNYKFDVTGQFFDIGLVLTGVPETWLEPETHEEEKVQVDIIINGTFSAGVNQERVVENASRLLAITKILEDHGVQLSLKIVACVTRYEQGKDASLYVATDIKAYDEPINYAKISALLTPTYLRRGVFKVMEVTSEQKVRNGYGAQGRPQGFIEIHRSKQIDALEKKLFTKDTK